MRAWRLQLVAAAVLVAALAPLSPAVAQNERATAGPGWDTSVSISEPRRKPASPAVSGNPAAPALVAPLRATPVEATTLLETPALSMPSIDFPTATIPSPAPPAAAPPLPSGPVASAATLSGDRQRTRLAFTLSAAVPFTTFRMTEPYRVVIDLPELAFRLPPGTGRQGRGLVTAYRYGLFAAGKARIVIDTAGPARVEAARMTPATDGSVRFEIDLLPTTAAELAATEIASAAAQGIDVRLPDAASAAAASPSPQRPSRPRARPVIVIDPGHGGIDGGAQGAHGAEKDVVLSVARQVRHALLATRRYEVVMTRSSDVFVSLDNRVRMSRRANADLFVSIHADSLAQKDLAQSVRGATVYTLAEKASDDRSRALAEKENAADLLAGINVASAGDDGQVRDILFDLMRRETANFASDFRGLLVQSLRPRMRLAKDPMRSGPFKVLRQPGSPAVLIELGYMSNAQDEQQMAAEAWQRGVADAVTRAIEDYFRRRQARNE